MLFLHNPSKIIGAIPGPSNIYSNAPADADPWKEMAGTGGQNRQNRGRREQDIRASGIQVGRTL